MCGICGIISLNQHAPSEVLLRRMMQIQKHRGPDDEGTYFDDKIGLGFVRLSILDLSLAGHQPMYSDDGRYITVFNGEIFNYIELRDELKIFNHVFTTGTDTEVLLAAYKEWGQDCLNHFNGMWAFAIYDTIDKSVFAARDRFGIKPFYYMQTEEYIAFASEIPPLLSLLPRKPTPDYQTIFDYLVFNRTDQTDATFFEGIKKLQHGHYIKFEINFPRSVGIETNVSPSKWYDLRANLKNPFQSPEEFRKTLSSSTGLRLRSDVPVGVCLSGGLDSTSIVSILLKDFNKSDLNTFSAVYNNGENGDETPFIKEFSPFLRNMFFTTPTAETLKNDLRNFIRAHAEPVPSTSPYAQFKVMELARSKVVVTLDGQGADESLAGYHYFFGYYFKDLLLKRHLGKLLKEIFYYMQNHRSIFGLKSFLFFLLPQKLRTSARVKEKAYLNHKFVSKYRKSNNIAGNLYGAKTLKEALLNHFEYKLEHLLKWEDRNSMWFSIEARVPFLDYRLVERVLATQDDKIIQNGMTKHILRESMKDLLPEKIRLRRDKVGFGTPQDNWFRTPEWEAIVLGVLSSNSFISRELIDQKKALSKYSKYLKGEKSVSNEIWKWINLELWFREFID